MKKIITIFLLSLLLVSCGEQDENTSIKETEIVKFSETDNSNLGKEELVEIINIEETQQVEVNKKLEKRKEILDKTFEHYSTLSLDSKANLNCEELNPIKSSMSKDEKKLAIITISKCTKMRNQARSDLAKEKEGFKISNCKYFIEEREKRFVEFNENAESINGFKGPNEEENKFLEQEIETCEIGYALQNGCDLLNDKSKKQKCEKFKELRNEKYELEQFMSFQKEDYIK